MVSLHESVVATADKLIELFNEARAKPAGLERGRFLDEACGDDLRLKQQILSLLQTEAEEGDTDFLTRTLLIRSAALVTEKPGDRIGRYKLLQQLGEGGCGVVYMAEQEEPVRRRVALKVIKLGMDTKSVIARFEAERQALALMDHPNIAKVFDAGATDTGRPFFVMELVRGIKITDYCDQNNLTTEQRLELFTQVCHAVQHAHQKGIIHRDLKPSNILVTLHDGVPVPKVIDFGVAKATSDQRLTDKTVFTAFEQFIGTPAYMSPEQAEMSGLDIDTRSDIYSLGVLLYELLTGKTPLDPDELLRSGMNEMRRKIREDEPPRPSTRLSTMQAADLTTIAKHRQADAPKLIHLVHGDLDWIVMKCLEKDRTRRYETANGLATDLKRHLNNEPVVARPPSRAYQFQKLVRRNKLAFAASAAVLLVLLGGIAASTWQAIRATRAEREQSRLRGLAQTEAVKSQQVATFLKDMLRGVGPSVALGRDTTMLREILDKTAERIGTDLKDHPEVEIELRLTLANAYGDLQLYKKAEEAARETLRLARAHFGEENLAVADALTKIGQTRMVLRGIDESESFSRQAIAMHRKLRGDGSLQEADSLITLGSALRHQFNLAGRYGDKAKLEEAETVIRAALAIRRKRLGNESVEVARGLQTLRVLLNVREKLDEAEDVAREGLAIDRKLYGDEHPETAASYISLGNALSRLNKLPEAEMCCRKGLEIRKRIGGAGKWNLGEAHTAFAVVLEKQGKLAEAELEYREALAIARMAMGEDHMDLPFYLVNVANILRRNGKSAEARSLAEDAVAICRLHPQRVERYIQDRAFGALRGVLTDLGETASVDALNALNLQLLRIRLPAGDPDLARVLAEFSQTFLSSGRFADAESLARESLTIFEKERPDEWMMFNARGLLGGSLLGQKKYAEAEPLLLSGYEGLKQREDKIPAGYKWQLKTALQSLVRLYEATGPAEKAAEWNRKLAEFDKIEAEKKTAAPKP
jgi:serine/threonine protein kinase